MEALTSGLTVIKCLQKEASQFFGLKPLALAEAGHNRLDSID